jgi:hypothetical protein
MTQWLDRHMVREPIRVERGDMKSPPNTNVSKRVS